MASDDLKPKAFTDDRIGIRGATQKKVNCSEWFPVFRGYGDRPKNLIALFKHEYNASFFCEIDADRKTIQQQAAMIERILTGGNHLALWLGENHPPYSATNGDALEHYGPGRNYDTWCYWKIIMDARQLDTKEEK